jgi:glucose/arabinose dehydrogenase/sugar lactone lactonase YvrE
MKHCLALRSDGTVIGWGDNSEWQVSVPTDLTNAVAIAAGAGHSLAMRSNGNVVAWGSPVYGAVEVPPYLTNVLAIATGEKQALALTLEPVITVQQHFWFFLPESVATVPANVIGTIPWQYQWLLFDIPIEGATNASLIFSNAQPSNSGYYSFIVSNQYGWMISKQADIQIAAPLPVISLHLKSETVLAGSNVRFEVEASDPWPLTYRWEFRGRVIQDTTNSTLLLTNVSELNEGTYIVWVDGRYETNGTPGYLTVNNPPIVSSLPQILTLPAGTNLLLRAVVRGDTPLSYRWLLGGTDIPGAVRQGLALSDVQRSDGGVYSIVVSNQFAIVTNVICSLTVADSPPAIFEQPASQLFFPGNNVAMRVRALGSAPMGFQWLHNGFPISAATNATLKLANTQPADGGEYSVTIANPLGKTLSDPAVLSIGDPYPGQADIPSISLILVNTNQLVAAPTSIVHAGDGSGRLFVTEQKGRVLILKDNQVQPVAFLDIMDRTLRGDERGLLSIAFPRGFPTNRHVYAYYTRKPDGAITISRFVSGANTGVIDSGSEEVLLTIPHPLSNHNGGQLAFGPDGFLYLGTGDGGYTSLADPLNNAQNPASLLGKLLRIDVESGVSPYAIPQSNPFVMNAVYLPEIWSLGLRNPWRFSFDRVTGDLYIGDVGHSSYEEVDYAPAGNPGGQNYGWKIREGPVAYQQPPDFDLSTLTEPIASYKPLPWGASIIGGYVYRGPHEPRLSGVYVFGDFVSGQIRLLKQIAAGWQMHDVAGTPFPSARLVSTFGEDEEGRLYLADYNSSRIFQLLDTMQVLAPEFSPNRGILSSNTVTVVCASPGARIHYTTDGREPTEVDPWVPSGGAVTIVNGQPIQARAFRPDLDPSPIVSAKYVLKVVAPAASPAEGLITNRTAVTLSSATSGAVIRYSIDGTAPDFGAQVYTSPFYLTRNTTLSARAFRDGFEDSDVLTQNFQLIKADVPTFEPAAGPVAIGTHLELKTTTPDATIRFTLDGTDPTSQSPLYVEAIVLSRSTTVKARTFRADLGDSDLQIAFFGLLDFEPTVVRVLAGDGIDGFVDGPRWSARFSSPQGICVDGTGNIFVSDTGNHRIRRIDPAGIVLTVAGTGGSSSADGPALTSQFESPLGLAIDSNNNLFIAEGTDSVKGRLRIISNLTEVTTVPILPWLPSGVEVSGFGDLYVSVYQGVVHIPANGAPADLLALHLGSSDEHVGLGPDGTIFVTGGDSTVYRSTANRRFEVFTGGAPGFNDGPRQNAGFASAGELALDPSGNIYVADVNSVRIVNPDGGVHTLAGTTSPGFVNGPGNLARFKDIKSICVDAMGTVYVADTGNHCIRGIFRDADGDGIPDVYELSHAPFQVGVDDRNVDSDHDGMNNAAEFLADTNPLAADSYLAIESLRLEIDGRVEIRWQSVARINYVVKYSDDLTTWKVLGSRLRGDGSILLSVDSTSIDQVRRRFYRVFVGDF